MPARPIMESRRLGDEPNHRAARVRHTHQESRQTRSRRSLGPQLLRARRAFDQDGGYRGRSTPVRAVLWSLGQELSYERTHVDRVQYFLGRDAFCDIAPPLDGACGSVLDTPLGGLLGDYMIAREERLPDVTEADFSGIAKALGAMVAAPSADRIAAARPHIDVGRKERVRQAVREHLRTPTFEPTVCAASSESPDPISIGCSKIPGVWPAILSASVCSRRTRC